MDERQHHRSTRCAAICADGSPCRAWAVRGTQPPRCAPHGGGRAPVGAPTGNQNARTHGHYARRDVPSEGWTLEALITDVAATHQGISRYIDRLLADDQLAPADVARLFAVYATSASRLESLLRERQAHNQIRENLRKLVTHHSQHQPASLAHAQGTTAEHLCLLRADRDEPGDNIAAPSGPTTDDRGPLFPQKNTLMNQETISPPAQQPRSTTEDHRLPQQKNVMNQETISPPRQAHRPTTGDHCSPKKTP